jgi:recombination protein RecA
MYNEGISHVGDLLDLAVELDIIDKRGSFYNYGDIRLAQGRENSKEFLRENPEVAEEIELAVRQQTMQDIMLSDFDEDDAEDDEA